MAMFDIGGEYQDIDTLQQMVAVIEEKTSYEFAIECEELMTVAALQARADIEGAQYDCDRMSEEWQAMRDVVEEINSQLQQYLYDLERGKIPFSRKPLKKLLSEIIEMCEGVL